MLWLWLACLIPSKEIERALDPDGDGFGPEDDCGPKDPTVYPGAEEVWYDGVDQDCGGGSDYDQDGDGFATAVVPDEGGLFGTDCDDGDSRVYPGAEEVCDEHDNDCDGEVNEGSAAPIIWYTDADGDGHMGSVWGQACTQPSGAATTYDDCNDNADDSTAPAVYPGAVEVCGDGVVNDCDGFKEAAIEECRWYGAYSLAEADLKWIGDRSGDEAGRAVSGVGDVDGDGRVDLLVGASSYHTGYRAAYLLLSSGALADVESNQTFGVSDLTIIGAKSSRTAVSSVSSAGDVDGDGQADLLVGDYGDDSIGDASGAAYLLLSSSLLSHGRDQFDLSLADLKFVGEAPGDSAGSSLSFTAANETVDESYLIVGAYDNAGGASWGGAVYFISASESLKLGETTLGLSNASVKLVGKTYERIGRNVSAGGDVDGDGQADVLVSNITEGAYLLLLDSIVDAEGTTIGTDDVDCRFTKGESGVWADRSAAIIGDVDGDGRADVAVTEPRAHHSGFTISSVYLVLSSGALNSIPYSMSLDAADVELIGEQYDLAGHAVSTAGDVDGDGRADLLVGAPHEAYNCGCDQGEDCVPDCICDEDCEGDVEPWEWDGYSVPGAVYVLLSSGSLSTRSAALNLSDAELKFTGEGGSDYTVEGDHIGTSLSPAGDVNGDGLDDLLIGSPYNDAGGTDAGAAYLLFGRSF